MNHFQNPFNDLTLRKYNVTNLKKVLDVTPTILETEHLTSTELLNQLRDLLGDRELTIQQLLLRLRDREDAASELENMEQTLQKLEQQLDIGDSIEESLTDSAKQAQINALLQQGYIQIGSTPLYALVRNRPSATEEFFIDHTKENQGFPESDLKDPSSVSFVNTSETDDVWIQKTERWQRDLDGFYNPERFTSSNFGKTNAFKFIEFPELHAQSYQIPSGTETATIVGLGYRGRGDGPGTYGGAGLKRSGDTNRWFGFMDLYASVGSRPNLNIIEPVSIGKMHIHRDRN